MAADRRSEFGQKCGRVRRYLSEHVLDGVLLSLRSNFAWLTGGGDNRVPGNTEVGAASLLVSAEGVWCLTSNIEAPRIEAEELDGLDVVTVSHPWHDPGRLETLVSERCAGSVAADDGRLGFPALGEPFCELRYELTDDEQDRFRLLGADCAAALEAPCRSLRPGVTEHAIAADLACGLLEVNVEPAVLLVAVDDRIDRYRHPIPSTARLKRRAMLVVCGQRGGLIAAATRLVHFGPMPADLKAKHEAACRVDAALILNTRPGAAWGHALQAGLAEYEAGGFAEEWPLHHQGGPTGYRPRDFIVTPGEERTVRPGQAAAWNPSITGTKSEDTIIALPDGPAVISRTGDWPSLTVEAAGGRIERPDILVL